MLHLPLRNPQTSYLANNIVSSLDQVFQGKLLKALTTLEANDQSKCVDDKQVSNLEPSNSIMDQEVYLEKCTELVLNKMIFCILMPVLQHCQNFSLWLARFCLREDSLCWNWNLGLLQQGFSESGLHSHSEDHQAV